MRDLGLGALAHANWHAHYAHENPWTPELSVLQAAHAAEVLIKARIAEEHPLLIFEDLPKPPASDGLLDFADLFERGKTVQYFDLPHRLWAATGLKLTDANRFREFGKLRNAIQHFAPPNRDDASKLTSEFVYGVIDPFINSCWGLYAIDYNEDTDPYEYLVSGLVGQEVLFLVSEGAADALGNCNDELARASASYREEILRRAQLYR
jgi:hypothetical protein